MILSVEGKSRRGSGRGKIDRRQIARIRERERERERESERE